MTNQTHSTAKHILLVEDDASVGEMLRDVLESEGYRASLALSGADARSSLDRERPDLIILDLRLPDTDGLVLCADLHSRAQVPIIIVSATSEKRDAILAFKLGADDFVAKPFDVDHLLARVEAALRRSNASSAPARTGGWRATASVPENAPAIAAPASAPAQDPRVRRCGNLVMDHARRRVTVSGLTIAVTPTEYRILESLIERADEVVTRDELSMHVWGFQDAGIGRSLDVHIRRLRSKLEAAPEPPPSIVSVRGFGYKLLPTEALIAA